MAGELAVDKMRIRLNVPVELVMKVIKTFSTRYDKRNNTAFVRALEEGCRDCILTRKDYAKIAEIIEENRKQRLKKRRRERLARSGAVEGAAADGGRCRFCGRKVPRGTKFCTQCINQGFDEVFASTGRSNGWDRKE